MGVPRELVQIAFSGGIDESVVDEVLDPQSSFVLLQNGRQNRQGGYDKRLGYTSLGAGARTAGRKLVAQPNGAPVVIDGGVAQVYSEGTATSTTLGRVPGCTTSLLPLPLASDRGCVVDVDVSGNFVATAYRGDALASVTVSDRVTGAQVSPTLRLTATGVVIAQVGFISGRYAMFLAFGASAGVWYVYSYDTQSPGSAWVSVANNIATPTATFACIAAGTDRVVLVVAATTGATVSSYNQSGVVDAQSSISASAQNIVDVVLSQDKTRAWIAFSNSGTTITVLTRLVSALATPVGTNSTTTTLTNYSFRLVADTAASGAWLFIDGIDTGQSGIHRRQVTVSGSIVTIGGLLGTSGALMCGRGYMLNGRIYVPMFGGGNQNKENPQGLLTIVDATDPNPRIGSGGIALLPVAHLEPGLITFGDVGTTFSTSKLAPYGTSLMFGFSVVTGGAGAIGCRLASLDFASRSASQPAAHARSTYLSGGVLVTLGPSVVSEVGFMHAPTTPSVALSATGITGTFRWVAVYEDVDEYGNWSVSGVSAPVLASPANQTANLSVSALNISYRASRATARAVFYRTLNGGNPPYYRVGSVSNFNSYQLTYSDALPDIDLASRPKLYAPNLPGVAGESLDRRAPPGLADITSYNGMLVGIKGDSVLYSSQLVYGEAPWFNPVFEVPVAGGGSFVALEPQDGTLFLFKSDCIYAISGDPPADNLSSGGLGQPRLLASDVGCIDPNSVVRTSAGIFFQSRRGIELLSRSSEVQFVGFKIAKTLAAYPIVTSAVLDQRSSLVRFSLAAAATAGIVSGEGRDLIFDLKLGTWASRDDKTGSSSHEASQDACVVMLGGVARYAWLGANGVLWRENLAGDAGAYLDGSAFIERAAETGFFKAGGIQGVQHVNGVTFLERRVTDHDATLALAYNYETGFRAPTTWTNAKQATLLAGGWPVTQIKHLPHEDARCQSLRVRVTDAAPSVGGTVGTGQASTWLALTIDFTPQPGAFDVPEITT